MVTVYLSELRRPVMERLYEKYKLKALLPVGSIEQHGPQLPLGTDTIICENVCKAVAYGRNDILLLPTIPYGQSELHMGFQGTITVSHKTLVSLVNDIGYSLDRQGIKRFIIANGHGGNSNPLYQAVSELQDERRGMEISFVDCDMMITENRRGEFIGHANDFETSILLYLKPELVDMSKACKELINPPRNITDLKKYSNSGVWGDPTNATAEKGEEYFRMMVSELTKIVDNEL